ncbi:MAG: metal-sensing transcriptional repressor [Eubacterium sp.]|nr:metal-sensing transcriptional repressor [Eubacterium sp.]
MAEQIQENSTVQKYTEEHEHTHTHEGDHVHTHDHDHEDAHTHDHDHEDARMHTHGHDHEEGHAHTHDESHSHDHSHGHEHSHTHDPKEVRAIVNRLSRCAGHLESVKRMVADGKDCSDVLIQLAAVRAELTNAGKLILRQHLDHCIVEAVEEGDPEALEKINTAIDKFVK